jgi:nitric oxide reductase subunit B
MDRKTLKAFWLLGGTLAVAFALLGFFGREVYRQAPPIPERVVSDTGIVLATKADILDGQQVWQSTGGQQLGSIWGHGAYQAPDWSADWLHREATALLDVWVEREGLERGALAERLQREMRRNTYDAETGTLTLSSDRVQAVHRVAAHYDALFGGNPALADLREDYAMREVTVPDAARRANLMHFFQWTAWACAAERPGAAITYTNNWPHEPLVGNRPTGANVLWTMASIVLLLAGVGAVIWRMAFKGEGEPEVEAPRTDPTAALVITPSMRAVAKYLVAVIGLFAVQVVLGALTAHYTVEGQSFFGLPLGKWLPYALTRTWHIQTGLWTPASGWDSRATSTWISAAPGRSRSSPACFSGSSSCCGHCGRHCASATNRARWS